ncbi:hypothetical protein HD554DRAFT_2035292 [Boletus coccyginus]|nr:hypothetical protein HD554DRAFT_2035292 [Boletus coccyginus]
MVRGTGKCIPAHIPPSDSLPLGQGSSSGVSTVRDSSLWLSLCRSCGGNAKKEDATGTSAGAAQPRLTCTERRRFYKELAVQKQDGTAGASGQDLVLDQNEIAASRTSHSKNAKKENAASTSAGAAQPRLTCTGRGKLQLARLQKIWYSSSEDPVLDQNEIAESRASRGEKAQEEDAASTRAGVAD